MSLPVTFGEFWPDGDFEGKTNDGRQGWGSRLSATFEDLSPSEQDRLFDSLKDNPARRVHTYRFHAVAKFRDEIGTNPYEPDDPPLSPIAAFEAPRFFESRKSYSQLGSLIMLNDRILAVDDDFREIIERFEPGMHRFFPIEIHTRNVVATFHTLVVGQWLDSFSPEHSQAEAFTHNGDRFRLYEKRAAMAGLAFSRAAFGNAQLWRERRIGERVTLLSDQLHAAIVERGLRVPRINKLKEI
ncbi:imm11 family protein [Sphingomonas astaxanthinifaciens]|nr:DUF1629 domain-containing protein [Sphingomonas astaxanthinifaciens]